MNAFDRREFLGDVGKGMLIVGLGTSLADSLGISAAFAEQGPDSLSFGKLQSLVSLMQETPLEKLQPLLVKKLESGETSLKQLIAAASLANAESFGGQDYVGYHTEMALVPALQLAAELPKERQPLPVLKVLYRNTHRMQQSGHHEKKMLKTVEPAKLPAGADGGQLLLDATRAGSMDQAEGIFAALVKDRSRQEAYNDLLRIVQDNANVHRFVLAHRAWQLIDVVGKEHAHTILRQCVRYCVDMEPRLAKGGGPRVRKLVPGLLDQYGLLGKKLGTRKADDVWVAELSQIVFHRNAEQACDAVAAAMAEGMSLEAVGEAISLAANQLVLRQDNRGNSGWRTHGAAPGVHSSDALNAWRNMVRVSDQRNAVIGLIVAAYDTGQYRAYEQGPYPHEKHREAVKTRDAKKLLAEAEDAIRHNDQGRACAAIAIYGEEGYAARPVFDLMLRYAISEDGRLHAEKYYRTVTEEFATIRPAFRWRQLVALARVTASAHGYSVDDKPGHRAPGYDEACRLLNVKA